MSSYNLRRRPLQLRVVELLCHVLKVLATSQVLMTRIVDAQPRERPLGQLGNHHPCELTQMLGLGLGILWSLLSRVKFKSIPYCTYISGLVSK